MATYKIKIQGVADMLQNRLSRELNNEMKDIPRAKKDEWDEQNWKRKLNTRKIDGEDKPIIPELVIYSMLSEACKKYRIQPPTAIGRTWTGYMKASVLIPDCGIIENAEIIPFGTMVNGNPSSMKKSSKVFKTRPLIKKGWTSDITIIDAESYLTKDIVSGLFETAGKFVGVGDWRPLYGRFVVKSVKCEAD